MERLGTPNPDGNDYTEQYPTPTKAKVQGTIEFCKKMKIPLSRYGVCLALFAKALALLG